MIRTFLLFSIIYILLFYIGNNPMNFESPVDAMYFSLTITSTVGFGDYVPKTNIAKFIVSIHMLTLITDLTFLLQ